MKYAFLLVVILSLVLRVFVMDSPQLNDWDEKYHALVSKNLIEHPLKPTLYENPVLEYEIDNWVGNHIWLSKPLFPLWNIAISIKLFGLNTMSVRLPSLLYSILSLCFVFKLGYYLFNKRVGLISAYLYAINGLFIELVGGHVSSDHVEIIFTSLFFASCFWFVKIKIQDKESILNYAILGGIVGISFLSKWHVALLFFVMWFIYVLLQKYQFKLILKLGFSMFLGFILVTLPLLFYLAVSYPNEFKVMFFGLVKPFNTVVQNHGEPWYYYFNKLNVIYGELIFLPLIFVIYKLFKFRCWKHQLLIIWIFVPLLLFSIAETKRYTYILIFAPALFIIISNFIINELPKLKIKAYLKIICIVILIGLPMRYNFERLKYYENNKLIIKETKCWKDGLANFRSKNNGQIVLFNDDNYIETMFYTDIISYQYSVSESIINALKTDGYRCYIYLNGSYELL